MQNQITTIFFDLFGVLLGVDRSVVVQYLSRVIEMPYLETREIAMGETYMCLERGEVSFSEYVNEICSILPNGDHIEKDVLRNMWMGSKIGEMPAVSFIQNFITNYQIWVVSNTSDIHIKRLRLNFPFLNHLSGIITSEWAGVHKPDPKIFQLALSEAGADAGSTVFIDDRRDNIAAAKNLGIITHHYIGFDELNSFLIDYLKI